MTLKREKEAKIEKGEKWIQQAWASLPLQVDNLLWSGSVLRGAVIVPINRNLCWLHKRLEGPDARSLLINAFAWRSIFVIAEYSQ